MFLKANLENKHVVNHRLLHLQNGSEILKLQTFGLFKYCLLWVRPDDLQRSFAILSYSDSPPFFLWPKLLGKFNLK